MSFTNKFDKFEDNQLNLTLDSYNRSNTNTNIQGCQSSAEPQKSKISTSRAVASGGGGGGGRGHLSSLRFEAGCPLKSAPRGLRPLDNMALP